MEILSILVSDTSFKDERTDKSGPILREYLSSQGFDCVEYAVVADDIAQIQQAITKWCKSGKVDWIVTTGGTGFGVRDTTPEVCLNISSLPRNLIDDVVGCRSFAEKGGFRAGSSHVIDFAEAHTPRLPLPTCCWHHWQYFDCNTPWQPQGREGEHYGLGI